MGALTAKNLHLYFTFIDTFGRHISTHPLRPFVRAKTLQERDRGRYLHFCMPHQIVTTTLKSKCSIELHENERYVRERQVKKEMRDSYSLLWVWLLEKKKSFSTFIYPSVAYRSL